jgi:hypothetical protein
LSDVKAAGGFSFIKVSGDISKSTTSMMNSGAVKVNWDGGKPSTEQVQALVDKVTEKFMDAVYDKNTIRDPQTPGAGPIPEMNPLKKVFGFSPGASFAVKKKEITNKGNFTFDFSRRELVQKNDARFSRLGDGRVNIDPKDKVRFAKHFRTVAPGDWGFVAPRVFVNADLDNEYTKIVVNVKYGKDEPAPAIFSKDQRGPIVPREWIPVGKNYQYQYTIQALPKVGAFPANVSGKTEYKAGPFTSSEPFLLLSSKDWHGPVMTSLSIGPVPDFDADKISLVVVAVKWNDAKNTSQTSVLKSRDQVDIKAGYLVFSGVTPRYTATVSWFEKGTNKRNGPYTITQGASGADAGQLRILLRDLK